MKKNLSRFFVTAIHTDSGKTLVSALLVKALKARYWKPVQCGLPTDSDQIRALTGDETRIFPERYRLSTPASPHFAAAAEGIRIGLEDFSLPDSTEKALIVEGAGGILVPLNEKDTLADLIALLDLPIILVINHYLGALNHGLLTIREIRQRGLRLAGLIFNGDDFQNAEPLLLEAAGCSCLLRLPRLDNLASEELEYWARKIEFPA